MKLTKFVKAFAVISFIFGSAVFSQVAFSEVVVIVHPSNNNTLSEKDIQRIFLRKSKIFPSGQNAIPIDLPLKSDTRKSFTSSVLKRQERQIKSYWARQVFTGISLPPLEVEDQGQVTKIIASNLNYIGYIDAGLVDESVKVVYKF